MPRLKAVDDSAQDASRRLSGRARRPTAKIEALAGTKFYPSDSGKAKRIGSASLSPGPSAGSSFSTPMSPQSDSAPHGSQDQTSPSTTISVQVISPNNEHGDKRATSTPASGRQSPNQTSAHSLRRERKPTQRALEMTESAAKPRRRRRTQAEMAALRTSATPSDISSTAEIESPTTDRRSSLSQHDDVPSIAANAAPLRAASRTRRGSKEPDDLKTTPSEDVPKKRNASQPVSRGRQRTLEGLPAGLEDSVASTIKNARKDPKKMIPSDEPEIDGHNSSPPRIANGPGSDKTRQSGRTSTQQTRHSRGSANVDGSLDDDTLPTTRRKSQQETSHPPPPEPETKGLRLKLNTRRSARVSAQSEAETPRRRARSSAVNYAEPELSAQDTSSDETMSNASDTSRRQPRARRALPDEAKPIDTKETTPATPGARRFRLRQPLPPAAGRNTVARGEADADVSTSVVSRAERQDQTESQTAVPEIAGHGRKRRASPPEEERPRKSLKLKLSVPGLKAPSKLRFSINSQDLSESPPKKALLQMRPNPISAATEKKRQGGSSRNAKEPSASTETPVDAQKTGPAPKLSRRAQAKAEARALGKIRQATESANHDRLYDTTYGGAASHYAPSMSLVRPAIDCGLFCLPEPSRILAFAKIAAQSIESDDEETSDGGRQPELLQKWLQKGGEHCVCNKPGHDHGEDVSDVSQDRSAETLQDVVTSRDEVAQNADVAAAIPDTNLPLDIPPVNSIMPKSQGRRVSAFYNVLTSSPTSGPSNNGSSASSSRQQSRSASTGKAPRSPAPVYPAASMSSSANTSTAARPSTGSYEERMRWDHQALERVRREAKEAGLSITIDMTYTQTKTLLEQHREQHSATGSEGTNTPFEVQAPGHSPSPGLSARAAGKLPEYARGRGRKQDNTTYAHIEDDTEDRLLQIIGESFKATMKRNKSDSAESRASTGNRLSPLGVRARS